MTDERPKISKSRRVALAGGAALVLGGAATSAVLAQQQQAQTVTVTATAGTFVAAVGEPIKQDFVWVANADGKDPLAQRDEWTKAVASRLGVSADRLKTAFDEASKETGFAMPMIGVKPTAAFNLAIEPGFAAAARALNLSEEQLKTEMQTKSIEEIARARNVDPNVVRGAIRTQRVSDLDKAVAEGKLPAKLADTLKSHLDVELDHLMRMHQGDGPRIVQFERAVMVPRS